jgi:hypothetical protein
MYRVSRRFIRREIFGRTEDFVFDGFNGLVVLSSGGGGLQNVE